MNCARTIGGGWWYSYCTDTALNGAYVTPGTYSAEHYLNGGGGMSYWPFHQYKSLKTSYMMFRRMN